MLLIECPWCGPRAEVEFRFTGEAHMVRPGQEVSDLEWAAYLYERDNARGRAAERWRHVHGCGQFFNAVRDSFTDVIECTYPAGEPRRVGAGIG